MTSPLIIPILIVSTAFFGAMVILLVCCFKHKLALLRKDLQRRRQSSLRLEEENSDEQPFVDHNQQRNGSGDEYQDHVALDLNTVTNGDEIYASSPGNHYNEAMPYIHNKETQGQDGNHNNTVFDFNGTGRTESTRLKDSDDSCTDDDMRKDECRCVQRTDVTDCEQVSSLIDKCDDTDLPGNGNCICEQNAYTRTSVTIDDDRMLPSGPLRLYTDPGQSCPKHQIYSKCSGNMKQTRSEDVIAGMMKSTDDNRQQSNNGFNKQALENIRSDAIVNSNNINNNKDLHMRNFIASNSMKLREGGGRHYPHHNYKRLVMEEAVFTTTSLSLPPSPSHFTRRNTLTGCSPRILCRPLRSKHSSASECYNSTQNEEALRQSVQDAVYHETSIFDSFSKLKEIYDYQSSKYALTDLDNIMKEDDGAIYVKNRIPSNNGDIYKDSYYTPNDTEDPSENRKSFSSSPNQHLLDENGACNDNEDGRSCDVVVATNDAGFSRAKILYDKCIDKMPNG